MSLRKCFMFKDIFLFFLATPNRFSMLIDEVKIITNVVSGEKIKFYIDALINS